MRARTDARRGSRHVLRGVTGRARRVALVLTASLISFATTNARSEPAARDDVDPAARRAYQAGREHYQRREYEQAIIELERAYQKYPSAELLYDIAQAARLGGDCAKALDYYRRFLATEPDEHLSSRTRDRVAEMQACVTAASSERPASERSPAAPAQPVAVPQAVSERPATSAPVTVPPRRPRASGGAERVHDGARLPAALGVGAVALAAWTFAAIEYRRYDSANAAASRICPATPPEACAAADISRHDTLTSDARSARSLVYAGAGVGLVAVVGSVALLLWPRSEAAKSATSLRFHANARGLGAAFETSTPW